MSPHVKCIANISWRGKNEQPTIYLRDRGTGWRSAGYRQQRITRKWSQTDHKHSVRLAALRQADMNNLHSRVFNAKWSSKRGPWPRKLYVRLLALLLRTWRLRHGVLDLIREIRPVLFGGLLQEVLLRNQRHPEKWHKLSFPLLN